MAGYRVKYVLATKLVKDELVEAADEMTPHQDHSPATAAAIYRPAQPTRDRPGASSRCTYSTPRWTYVSLVVTTERWVAPSRRSRSVPRLGSARWPAGMPQHGEVGIHGAKRVSHDDFRSRGS